MEGARSKTPCSTKNIERFKSMRAHIDENNENLFQKHRLQANASFIEHLNEPEKEEMPQMLEKDPDSFYEVDMKYPRYQPSIKRGEIRYKTLGYREQEIPGERYITINEFFEPRPGWSAKAKCRLERGLRAALIGSAGSGKTTILGRFAREATKGNIPQMKDDFLVHQVNCRELDPKKEISVPEFLFKIMLCKQLPSKEDMEIGWRWIQENAKNTALIIDSLDTMRFSLESVKRVIGPDDKATPDVILHNLLTGELFREGFVLTSSREYKIKGYEGALRPDKVISLAGLTKMSVRNLTKGFLGEEEGERVLGKLEQYPGLKELCETPVFLIFTIIGLKQEGDASAFVPKSMTGVLMNLVNCLSRSKHARTRERFSEEEFIAALNKMKDLAYNGMLDDRVLYNEEDLENAKLTIEEISDVAMIIPKRIEKTQQILETGAVSFFIHQTIGELFCALKICEIELKKFRQLVSKHLHKPKYSVIRLLICGVLLDDNVFKEASRLMLKGQCDYKEKRSFLLKSLEEQLSSSPGQTHFLELCASLSEAGESAGEIMRNHIHEVDFHGFPLFASDTFAIGSVIGQLRMVEKVDIQNCEHTLESLHTLKLGLGDSDVKIEMLLIDLLHSEWVPNIAKLIEQCRPSTTSLRVLPDDAAHALLKIGWRMKRTEISGRCKHEICTINLIVPNDSSEETSGMLKKLYEMLKNDQGNDVLSHEWHNSIVFLSVRKDQHCTVQTTTLGESERYASDRSTAADSLRPFSVEISLHEFPEESSGSSACETASGGGEMESGTTQQSRVQQRTSASRDTFNFLGSLNAEVAYQGVNSLNISGDTRDLSMQDVNRLKLLFPGNPTIYILPPDSCSFKDLIRQLVPASNESNQVGFPTRDDTRPPTSRRVHLKPEEQGATEVPRKKRKKDDE